MDKQYSILYGQTVQYLVWTNSIVSCMDKQYSILYGQTV